jgi:hypothetical protein
MGVLRTVYSRKLRKEKPIANRELLVRKSLKLSFHAGLMAYVRDGQN